MINQKQFISRFPSHIDFEKMSKKEAKQYLDSFVSQIPVRLNGLAELTGLPVSGPLSTNEPKKMLHQLGAWLDTHLQWREISPQELETEKNRIPEWAHDTIASSVISDTTVFYCVDIGIYFGQLLLYSHPKLRWDFVRSPKSDADFQQPVITGFNSKLHCNPIRIMIVIAYKIMNGGFAAIELPNTFGTWLTFTS